MSTRRNFIKQSALTATGTLLFQSVISSSLFDGFDRADKSPRNILLRSGWQIENIGDIAHTPAMLALIEKYIPDAIVTFWPWYHVMPDNELKMLKNRFPKMRLVEGKVDASGKATTQELQEAFDGADFLLHNSGPATIAWADLAVFKKMTGKTFGVYGVTYGLYGIPEREILSEAAFVYFRDSISLQKAKDAGITAPIMGFTPDAVFSIDVTDDEKADAFLKANKLDKGNFLCCIPKQRHTPSWLHKHKNRPVDTVRHARNEEMKEHDHIPLRKAITEVVRNTNLKVLICHEDETEMSIGKEWLLDKLPDDVKPKVVWLDRTWLTDEAISVYKRSAGMFGSEMHSPIMCIGNGIPAIVVRWEEQSSKGIMWKDIGLGEWLFDFDNNSDVERFVPAVIHFASNLKKARKKAAAAQKFVHDLHRKTMQIVASASQPKSSATNKKSPKSS